MSKIYVIGHKSPDTDSIAAAISYCLPEAAARAVEEAVGCQSGRTE